jgi:hypothetical protein
MVTRAGREEPPVAGRTSSGGRRHRGHGAAVCSGRGRGGDGRV